MKNKKKYVSYFVLIVEMMEIFVMCFAKYK